MKAVSPFAVLLLFGVVSLTCQVPLQAGTVNCVPQEGCPEGMGPPDCCAPPPCEFKQQLKFARAYRDNLKDIAIGLSMVSDTSATGMAAEAPWADQSVQAFNELLDQASPCPENPFFEDPPFLEVRQEDQCEITYWGDFDKKGGPASLEDMHDEVNSCVELVEAKYQRAEAQRQICLTERHRSDQRTLHERMMQDLAEAQAEVDTLETYQRFYETACSVTPDSQPAQQAVDDDLAPLLTENDEDELAPLTPDPKPKAKKKNKRTGKKGGRR